MIALLAVSARAGCDAATLQSAIDHAESAFVEMDASAFSTAAAEARDTLACEHDALTPVQCAGFHRMNALEAFLRADHANAVLYFQAVLGTQPGYELPVEIAPIGHPLRDDFDKSKQFAEAARFDLPAPASGWLTVDGARSTTAPSSRPFLFQWLDDSGHPQLTAWVDVGRPVPAYPRPAVAPVPNLEPPPPPPPHKVSAAWTAAGLGAAAVGAGLYGGAFVVRGDYYDAVDAGRRDDILALHQRTNAFTIAGAALLGVGGVFTIVGVF
jgi:hypothetical protein